MNSTSSAFSTVKVNVKLCGSIPRREIDRCTLSNVLSESQQSEVPNGSYTEQLPSLVASESQDSMSIDGAAQLCSQLSSLQNQDQSMPSSDSGSSPNYEAPGWAVPACGEARLEPVFDSVSRQSPIDLTQRAVFRIGRSPTSNVQLIHATSSRKHAMLFHHKNGSCYIIDCNSAHGTFVNGVRITSPPSDGVVIPHKVKRGSIIRFGGPGAPSFMLKSFSFGLDEMRDYPATALLSPASAITAEVEHNTRFNALGSTAKSSLMMSLSCKRSFDSMSTVDEADFDDCKRSRCSSPPLSPQQYPVRLVSPDLATGHKRRRVSFSNAPPKAFYPNLVSPYLSSDEADEELV
eukprot:scaffold12194_cov129-Cylindrotheca_fusiformis.AAC.5